MLKAKTLLIPLLVMALLGACASSTPIPHAQFQEVEVMKRVVIVGQSESYRLKLRLPLRGDSLLLPKDIDAASLQLRTGTPRQVLELSQRIVLDICNVHEGCSALSTAVWDKFFFEANDVEIEPGYSLAEFLERYYVAVADAWKLDGPCSDGEQLCRNLHCRYDAPGSVFAELFFRKAILDSLEVEAGLSDLVGSMDGAIETKDIEDAGCKR